MTTKHAALDVNGQALQSTVGARESEINHPVSTDICFELGVVIATNIYSSSSYLRGFTITKLFNHMMVGDASMIQKLSLSPEKKLSLYELVGTYQRTMQCNYILTQEREKKAIKPGPNPADGKKELREEYFIVVLVQ